MILGRFESQMCCGSMSFLPSFSQSEPFRGLRGDAPFARPFLAFELFGCASTPQECSCGDAVLYFACLRCRRMSSASAAQVVLDGLVKEKINLSDTLKKANGTLLDAIANKADTKKIEEVIADIKKELKEVEEKIARKEAEIARKEAEQKQGTLVVVVVVLFFGADLRVIVRVVLSKPCLRWVRFFGSSLILQPVLSFDRPLVSPCVVAPVLSHNG